MICSRYIPRAEMRRSAIQSFLCTSQHCYSHGVRTRSNTHLRDAELQSLSRAAVLKQSCFKLFSGDFYGMFCLQGSEEAIYMKVFVWKSYWCMFSPNSSAFFFFFCSLLGSVRFVHFCRCGRETCSHCIDSIPFHVLSLSVLEEEMCYPQNLPT